MAAASRSDRAECVDLDDHVHELEQMLLGANGKEFWLHARVKTWIIGISLTIVYFFARKTWTGSIDVDVLGFPLLATYGLMKIVTPQVPIEAHAVGLYYEVRRIALGVLYRRRLGSYQIAPYSLMSRTYRSRPW